MISTKKITSRDNARLKHVRRVRDGKAADAVLVEGVRLCEEALRSKMQLGDCFVSSNGLNNDRVKVLAAAVVANGIRIHEISEDLFRSIVDTESPQGILLVCSRPGASQKGFERHFRLLTEHIPLVIYLDEVNNPANLGAIVRTAEAAGAAGIIISKNSADPFSPKALRASTGSAFRIPIWFGASRKIALDWAREHEFVTTAADVGGTISYTRLDWKVPRLLVFGSEAHGLDDTARKKINDLITIPMNPEVESLNLAVSAGVILFEAKRQLAT